MSFTAHHERRPELTSSVLAANHSHDDAPSLHVLGQSLTVSELLGVKADVGRCETCRLRLREIYSMPRGVRMEREQLRHATTIHGELSEPGTFVHLEIEEDAHGLSSDPKWRQACRVRTSATERWHLTLL